MDYKHSNYKKNSINIKRPSRYYKALKKRLFLLYTYFFKYLSTQYVHNPARCMVFKLKTCVKELLAYSLLQPLLLWLQLLVQKMKALRCTVLQAIRRGQTVIFDVSINQSQAILFFSVAFFLHYANKLCPINGFQSGLGASLESLPLFKYYQTLHWYIYTISDPLVIVFITASVLSYFNKSLTNLLPIACWQLSRVVLFTLGPISNNQITRESIATAILSISFGLILSSLYKYHKRNNVSINYRSKIMRGYGVQ